MALSGLGILQEHHTMDVDGEGDGEEGPEECEPRGRKLGRALESPVRPARAEVRQETAVGEFDLPNPYDNGPSLVDEETAPGGRSGMETARGGRETARGGKSRNSRSISRDRAAKGREGQERRSKSLGYVLRERVGDDN